MKKSGRLTRRLRGRLFSRFLRDDDGAAAIEFSLTGLAFIVLLIGIIEVGMMVVGDRMLSTSSQTMARLLKTGQIQNANSSSDQFRTDLCALDLMFLFRCDDIAVDVRQVDDFTPPPEKEFDDEGNLVTDSFCFDSGDPKSIVMVRIVAEWPTLIGWSKLAGAQSWRDGRQFMEAVVAFRNEPFTPIGGATGSCS